ncbi:MAG: trigger factor [Pseudomonadota bacterium]|nr:trigger factor [Pseudomonadota bacterium]
MINEMNINVEKPSELERCLKISLPEEVLEDKIASRLSDLQKTVRVDGFRKGKIPQNIVRQRFGQQVRSEIVGELVQSSFGEAVQKEALRPAGQPVIDELSSKAGDGLSYTAKFEVFPEVSLKPMDNLTIEKKKCTLKSDDVDKVIQKLRDQHRDWIEKKGKAEEGDKLHIAYRGSVDGEEFEGGIGEDENLVLGNHSMMGGFEEGLIGVSAGESRTLDLRFPKDYRKDELSDKPVKFEVEIRSVMRSELPALDESFMKKFGAENGNKEEFSENIKKRLENEVEAAIERDLNQDVMSALLDLNRFDVPKSLTTQETDRSREQVMRSWFMRGKNPKEAAEEFDKELEVEAAKRVRSGLIMAEIVKEGELKAEPERIQQAIDEIAAGYEDSAAVSKWYNENKQQKQMIESQCLEKEVLKWVLEKVKVTEKAVSFDDLMDPMQTTAT